MSELPSPPPIEAQPPVPSPEVIVDLPTDERIPAFLGLRRFINTVRLARTTENLDELDASDRVIVSAARGAQEIRGFRSSHEDPDVVPVTRIERINALHRENQVRKTRRNDRERWRINEVYGTPKITEPTPVMLPPTAKATDVAKWTKMVGDIEKADGGVAHVLGTPENNLRLFGRTDEPRFGTGSITGDRSERERMRGHRRRSEASATKLDRETRQHTDQLQNRLNKAARGRTVPAKIREARLSSGESREERLTRRQGELRRLSQVKTARKAAGGLPRQRAYRATKRRAFEGAARVYAATQRRPNV